MLGFRHTSDGLAEQRELRDADAETGRHEQLTTPPCGQKEKWRHAFQASICRSDGRVENTGRSKGQRRRRTRQEKRKGRGNEREKASSV